MIPRLPHPWDDDPPETFGMPPSIMVFPLQDNKRPVGFAPWPEERKKKRKKKKRKKV